MIPFGGVSLFVQSTQKNLAAPATGLKRNAKLCRDPIKIHVLNGNDGWSPLPGFEPGPSRSTVERATATPPGVCITV